MKPYSAAEKITGAGVFGAYLIGTIGEQSAMERALTASSKNDQLATDKAYKDAATSRALQTVGIVGMLAWGGYMLAKHGWSGNR